MGSSSAVVNNYLNVKVIGPNLFFNKECHYGAAVNTSSHSNLSTKNSTFYYR